MMVGGGGRVARTDAARRPCQPQARSSLPTAPFITTTNYGKPSRFIGRPDSLLASESMLCQEKKPPSSTCYPSRRLLLLFLFCLI